MNLNVTKCSQGKFSLINMYKNVWGNKLENEALFKKRKLRAFYCFKSVFQKGIYKDTVKNSSHQQALTHHANMSVLYRPLITHFYPLQTGV